MIESALARTPLYDVHRALGARMVPFAGFEMPVQYASILREHDAVRKRAGLFDLSHMAQFELRGERAAAFLERLTCNAVESMKLWGARYNIVTNESGGAHDDIIVYRLPDRMLVVANAANERKIAAHFAAHAQSDGVEIVERHRTRALIALQGPAAAAMLASHADGDVAGMRYYSIREMRILGRDALVARTGYTGEDGFEIFVEAEAAAAVFRTLLESHRGEGLEPAGLGSRDVLRLEAGMPLYGHELDEEISPYQAGLDWVVKLEKGDFIGREALRERRETDAGRIVGMKLHGRVPAREGYVVTADGEAIGTIRSATTAPSVGNAQIATALVLSDRVDESTEIAVEIRGTLARADVVPLPFYARPRGG